MTMTMNESGHDSGNEGRGRNRTAPPVDADAHELDDVADREELRTRYYGLLQENRVLVPGVQVLVAFLFTVPFNARFTELDAMGEGLWLASLLAGSVAVVTLMAPIVFHRLGGRRRRADRLTWAIRMQRCGIVCIAISMCLALAVVARFAIGSGWALAVVGALIFVIIGAWVVIPQIGSSEDETVADGASSSPSPSSSRTTAAAPSGQPWRV
jgi:hypothetical protein